MYLSYFVFNRPNCLKKIASILLLCILFFNWYGYRILSDILQNQSDTKLEAKLDRNDYDESQLIELRVPINLPYHNDWKDFERYNGSIEIDGVHYNYVKRKVERGELVLLCLPNDEKQHLQSARDQFFKLVNDLQQPASGKKSSPANTFSIKGITSEYQQEKNDWTIAAILTEKAIYPEASFAFLKNNFSTSPEQPPEQA